MPLTGLVDFDELQNVSIFCYKGVMPEHLMISKGKKLSLDTCNRIVFNTYKYIYNFKTTYVSKHHCSHYLPVEGTSFHCQLDFPYLVVKWIVRRVAKDSRTTQKDLQDLEAAGKCVKVRTMWCPYRGNGVRIHRIVFSSTKVFVFI